jgi:hypothetical protein
LEAEDLLYFRSGMSLDIFDSTKHWSYSASDEAA